MIIKPSKLKKGDKVAIVSLSSGILGEDFCLHQIELGTKRLNELGLEVVFMPNSLKGLEYIKNNPKSRASDLKEAFFDDSINAIICAIGGDDTFKILPFLMEDKEFINKIKSNPKIFLGFSDSTNNHFMFSKLGLVTYYGLNFLSDLAELENEMLPYTKNSFLKLFNNDKEYEIKSSNTWYLERKDFSKNQVNVKRISYNEDRGFEVLRGSNVVEGYLFGGCLESIYDMFTGSRYKEQKKIYEKYEILPTVDEWKEKILFLETSEELISKESFSLMIDELIDRNIIKNVKAILLGKPQDGFNYEEYKEVLYNKTKEFNTPIIINVNFGHALPHAIIPYNLKTEINFNNKTIKVTEEFFR